MLERWHGGGGGKRRIGGTDGAAQTGVATAMRRRLRHLAAATAGGGGMADSNDEQDLARTFVRVGLYIVRESRGPMRLWDFSNRLAARLNMPHVPAGELCDAVKATLSAVDDSRLRVLAPPSRGTGAGYVFDATDPDACPVRR